MMQKPFNDGKLQSKENASELPQEDATDYAEFSDNSDNHASIDANHHEQERSLEEHFGGDGGIDKNKEKPLCRYFQRGFCRYNEGCRYSHESDAPISVQRFGVLTHPKSTTPCRYFAKGYCRYEDNCRFAHGGGRFHHGNGLAPVDESNSVSRGEWSRFPDEDVSNALSQGVKPWDEDAQIMEAMNQPRFF